jgi:flagellar protein FlbD
MITLSRIDGREIVINADEIEFVEGTHDTTVSLISGKKIIVKDSPREIIDKVIEYKQKCFSDLFHLPIDRHPIE